MCIRVEVVYAQPQRAICKSYELRPGSTVADVLRLAALDTDFTGVEVSQAPRGIFGKLAPAEQVLKQGDRIEIYRPLRADPKTARRLRAQQAQSAKRP